nr:7,8-dihydro-8-oxoguanine triphosphatase isoform X2 [Globicephala melas]
MEPRGELVMSVSGSFRTQSQFFLDTLTFTWEEPKPREVEQCARDHTGLQTAAPLPSCPSQACVDKSSLLCHPLSPTRSGLAPSLPSLPPRTPQAVIAHPLFLAPPLADPSSAFTLEKVPLPQLFSIDLWTSFTEPPPF